LNLAPGLQTRIKHEPNFLKYSEPEPLLAKNPNRIQTQNFGFFPISITNIYTHADNFSQNFVHADGG